jgi:hypothetical protein
LNNDNYQGTAACTLMIAEATPLVTWANPADIVYGTPLGASQLNASSTISGRFVYRPAAGTVLNAGSGQILSATFTPTDTSNYNSVFGITETINVVQAPLTILTNNAGIVRGTAIPPLSVNYNGFVNGDTPASLTTLPKITIPATPLSQAGTYPIVASGASSSNYAINYASGVLIVIPAPVKILDISVHTVRMGKSQKTAEVVIVKFSEWLNTQWMRGSMVLLLQRVPLARSQAAEQLQRSIMQALQEWQPTVHRSIFQSRIVQRRPPGHKNR